MAQGGPQRLRGTTPRVVSCCPYPIQHHVKKGTSLASVRTALGHEILATTSLCVGLAREQMDKELQQNALRHSSHLEAL